MRQYDLGVKLEHWFSPDHRPGDPNYIQHLFFSIPLCDDILPSVDTVSAINLICSRVKAALEGLLHEEAQRIHKMKDPT